MTDSYWNPLAHWSSYVSFVFVETTNWMFWPHGWKTKNRGDGAVRRCAFDHRWTRCPHRSKQDAEKRRTVSFGSTRASYISSGFSLATVLLCLAELSHCTWWTNMMKHEGSKSIARESSMVANISKIRLHTSHWDVMMSQHWDVMLA